MRARVFVFLISVMFTAPDAIAQRGGDTFNPLPQRTVETDREALRLMRNDKLDLILPGAMRDNDVDMWIHIGRSGDLMRRFFGSTSGYLIFTDLGDRIERAVFGGSQGAVENIDVRGSFNLTRAFSGYNYNNSDPRQGFSVPEVYNEITDYVAKHDPQTIAVNFSDWLPVADGISHSQYLKLESILGSRYSARIVSAEKVINDFLVRRTSREVAAQVEMLALARQSLKKLISGIIPGETSAGYVDAQVLYSASGAISGNETFESATGFRNYILQRGDYFYSDFGNRGSYMGFGVDTKIHVYILREGETKVPDFIQKVFDKAIAGQWILRDHMKVGMTGGESLDAMVKAMEEEGYIYTPFMDNGTEDYMMIQKALANTDKPGFSIDNHSMGNIRGDIRSEGTSMAAFRVNTLNLKIQENHLFAFEYMVHMNIAERPGFPLSINVSNVQIITSKGVEFIQPPNEEIILIK